MPRPSFLKIAAAVLVGIFLCFWYSTTSNPSQLQKQGELFKDGDQTSEAYETKIVMIIYNDRETSYDILSLSNKFLYGKKHGYDIDMHFTGTGVWHKLNLIEDALKTTKYEWIWWLDYDTLITNTTVKLTNIIYNTLHSRLDRDNIDLILTPDCWPLNAGSMLIRANPEVNEFLALIRACGDETPGASEQDCMRDVVGVNKDIPNHPLKSEKWAKKTIMIPQKTMNAFPEEIHCQEAATDDRPSGLWQPGDFVVHFAGAWAHVQEEDPAGFLMQKYRRFIDST